MLGGNGKLSTGSVGLASSSNYFVSLGQSRRDKCERFQAVLITCCSMFANNQTEQFLATFA